MGLDAFDTGESSNTSGSDMLVKNQQSSPLSFYLKQQRLPFPSLACPQLRSPRSLLTHLLDALSVEMSAFLMHLCHNAPESYPKEERQVMPLLKKRIELKETALDISSPL